MAILPLSKMKNALVGGMYGGERGIRTLDRS